MSEETVPAAQVADSHAVAANASAQQRTSVRELVESLLVTVLLALFGTTFVVQAFKIPSQSMEPTLLVGDHLLVNKFIFGGRGHWYDAVLPYRDVRRGDIIVFKFPYQDHPHYVKRVIGMPGDHIKMVDQTVYVNGHPVPEPFAYHDPNAPYDPFLYNFPPSGSEQFYSNMQPEWANDIANYVTNGEIVVPPGRYFAMGDNRDHSWDSRYWGFVDRDAIMGRPLLIYWSLSGADDSEQEGPSPPPTVPAPSLIDQMLQFPSRLRWKRMLHTVH
jgi:signal peptidase I